MTVQVCCRGSVVSSPIMLWLCVVCGCGCGCCVLDTSDGDGWVSKEDFAAGARGAMPAVTEFDIGEIWRIAVRESKGSGNSSAASVSRARLSQQQLCGVLAKHLPAGGTHQPKPRRQHRVAGSHVASAHSSHASKRRGTRPPPGDGLDDDDFEFSDDEDVPEPRRAHRREAFASPPRSTAASSAGGMGSPAGSAHYAAVDDRVPRLWDDGTEVSDFHDPPPPRQRQRQHKPPRAAARPPPSVVSLHEDAVVLGAHDISRMRGMLDSARGGARGGGFDFGGGSVASDGWGSASVMTRGSSGSHRPRFGGKGMGVTHPTVLRPTADMVDRQRDVIAACARIGGGGNGHAGDACVSRAALRTAVAEVGVRVTPAQVRVAGACQCVVCVHGMRG